MNQPPPCPYCGSDEVLPHETDKDSQGEYSLWIIFLAAALLVIGYFAIVVSSYVYFPIAIFIFTLFSAIVINRREKRRRNTPYTEKDFICLDCSQSFKARGRWMS